jgi:hypothetical protein
MRWMKESALVRIRTTSIFKRVPIQSKLRWRAAHSFMSAQPGATADPRVNPRGQTSAQNTPASQSFRLINPKRAGMLPSLANSSRRRKIGVHRSPASETCRLQNTEATFFAGVPRGKALASYARGFKGQTEPARTRRPLGGRSSKNYPTAKSGIGWL